MIVLDTSAVLAVMDATDPAGEALAGALTAEAPPLIIPAATLGELGYMIERELGRDAMHAFLADIAERRYLVSFEAEDAREAILLDERFVDLDLGLVDASVVACALRFQAPIATFDRRDFGPVAAALGIRLVP